MDRKSNSISSGKDLAQDSAIYATSANKTDDELRSATSELGRSSPTPPWPSLLAIEEFAAAASMSALALITFGNVVVRYATDASFAFTEEISIVLMVIITLLGASLTIAKDKQIRVEFFVNKLPLQFRRLIIFLSLIPVVATTVILVLTSSATTYDEYVFQVTSPALSVPEWIYSIWLPLLSLLILIRTLSFMIKFWRSNSL
jgi:TRAP-type C4-dicarboxylate transport system permease small subunit